MDGPRIARSEYCTLTRTIGHYLDDRSPNHKDSAVIMRGLEDAIGINGQALTEFQPGMTGAREKLQWTSMRVTTLPEDIAYSLFGIFGVRLPIIPGETKQDALGRLLQEIIALSGDISCLENRQSSIAAFQPTSLRMRLLHLHCRVYLTRKCQLRSPRCDMPRLHIRLLNRTPDFETCPLGLPSADCVCLVLYLRPHKCEGAPRQDQETRVTHAIKANGLHDLLVATEDGLIPFSH